MVDEIDNNISITEDNIRELTNTHLLDKVSSVDDLVALSNILQLNLNSRMDVLIEHNKQILLAIGNLNKSICAGLCSGISITNTTQKYLDTIKGTEGYALSSANIDERLDVIIGNIIIKCVAKEIISKHEKIVLVGGTENEPYAVPAIKGIRMNKNQVMINLEIRDVNTHTSDIADCSDFSVVTIYIANSLDQSITIQVKGNIEDSKSGAVNIGSTFTVAAGDYEARTLEPTDEGWLPYVYFTVVASTEPSLGSVTGTILRRN